MGSRARRCVVEVVRVDGVVHVGLVVRAVEVLAVPAGREVVRGEDTARAGAGREVAQQRASVASRQALVVETDVSVVRGRAAHGHSESL